MCPILPFGVKFSCEPAVALEERRRLMPLLIPSRGNGKLTTKVRKPTNVCLGKDSLRATEGKCPPKCTFPSLRLRINIVPHSTSRGDKKLFVIRMGHDFFF